MIKYHAINNMIIEIIIKEILNREELNPNHKQIHTLHYHHNDTNIDIEVKYKMKEMKKNKKYYIKNHIMI